MNNLLLLKFKKMLLFVNYLLLMMLLIVYNICNVLLFYIYDLSRIPLNVLSFISK